MPQQPLQQYIHFVDGDAEAARDLAGVRTKRTLGCQTAKGDLVAELLDLFGAQTERRGHAPNAGCRDRAFPPEELRHGGMIGFQGSGERSQRVPAVARLAASELGGQKFCE